MSNVTHFGFDNVILELSTLNMSDFGIMDVELDSVWT